MTHIYIQRERERERERAVFWDRGLPKSISAVWRSKKKGHVWRPVSPLGPVLCFWGFPVIAHFDLCANLSSSTPAWSQTASTLPANRHPLRLIYVPRPNKNHQLLSHSQTTGNSQEEWSKVMRDKRMERHTFSDWREGTTCLRHEGMNTDKRSTWSEVWWRRQQTVYAQTICSDSLKSLKDKFSQMMKI